MLSHYAPNLSVASSKISQSALPLLVWHLTTSAFDFSASVTAHFTILCDTVLVNRIIRSGLPI